MITLRLILLGGFFLLQGCVGSMRETSALFALGSERVVTPNPSIQAETPAVAWNGEDFLVVWSEQRQSAGEAGVTGADLGAIRLTPDGDPAERGPWALSSAPGNQTRPAVAWGGEVFLIVWEDTRSGLSRIFGARVDANGVLLDREGFALTKSQLPQSSPVVTWTGSAFLVVWNEDAGGSLGLDLYGVMIEPGAAGTAMNGFPIATGTGNQYEAAVAWGANQGLVVWSDQRAGGDAQSADLYAVRIDREGRRLDQAARLISGAPGGQHHPAAAWDGTQFLLLWVDQREGNGSLYGARLLGNGHLQDPAGIQLTRGPLQIGPPALVALSDRVVALWAEMGGGRQLLHGQVWALGFGLPVDAVARSLDEPPVSPISGGGAVAEILSAEAIQPAFDATGQQDLLIVWGALRPGSFVDHQIVARSIRVTGDAAAARPIDGAGASR